jgi:hypothetical protein
MGQGIQVLREVCGDRLVLLGGIKSLQRCMIEVQLLCVLLVQAMLLLVLPKVCITAATAQLCHFRC